MKCSPCVAIFVMSAAVTPAFARAENNLKAWAAIEQFFAKYLGGRAEPPSDKERVDDLRK